MKKILIIDDDADICQLLNRFLSKHGFKVTEALRAKTGIDILKKEPYDLVICDFRLPDMDGLELLPHIKKISPKTAVIMITAYSDVKVAVKAIKRGAHEYVTKPIHPDEILASVNDALKKSAEPAVKQVTSAASYQPDYVVGSSVQAKRLEKAIDLIAPTDMTVIIQGESGTGKEYAANAIHRKSKRSKKPFVAIDCGALSKEIAGSELFGHVKGAFTGAVADKMGHFEMANGGTLFLDEIGNLSYENQIKLLRVLQERKIKRIGGTKDIDVDVRVIVATNEDIKGSMREDAFREDLYFRLNEFMIEMPALRERKTDIMVFAEHFMTKANHELDKKVDGFSPEVKEKFMNYYWYGNLRELKNVVKRAVLLTDGPMITLDALPNEIINPEPFELSESAEINSSDITDLKSVTEKAEKNAILSILERTGYNKTKTADILKIDRKTLYNKIKAYNIDLKHS